MTTDPEPSEGSDQQALEAEMAVLREDGCEQLRAQLAAKDEALRACRNVLQMAKPIVSSATVCGCNCMTKTPVLQYHAEHCRYRQACEVYTAIEAKIEHVGRSLSPDSGNEVRERMEKAERERDAAASERVACHALFDDVLALCGYGKDQSYPGIVGAVQNLKNAFETSNDALKMAEMERDTALAELMEAQIAVLRVKSEKGQLAEDFRNLQETVRHTLAELAAVKVERDALQSKLR